MALVVSVLRARARPASTAAASARSSAGIVGAASAADLAGLIRLAQGRIEEQFGIAMEPEVTFPMRTVIYREISIVGCCGFTHEVETALALIASGRLQVKPLITHTFPLAEVQQAFQTAADPAADSIKVLVVP